MIELRDYQQDALKAIHAAKTRGVHAAAVGLPTGTGKTIVFSKAVEELGHPALILAHTDELIQQAADKYAQVDPSTPIGIVKARQHQADLPVVVASVQSLNAKRLAQMPTDFKTIVIDECHHATAPTYRRILEHFRPHGAMVLGFSATLERGDKKALGKVFDEIVYHRSMLDMIAQGYLVDIRPIAIEMQARLADLRVVRGDFQDNEVAEMLQRAGANKIAAHAYLQHAAGRKAIVFTPTIETAQDFADAFQAEGVRATTVSGALPLEERRERIRAFRDGEFDVCTNAMVLTEGFDMPAVDCVIVARPTKSRPFYIQMVGRGTRLYPGKTDLIVLDLVGNDKSVDLVTIPRLFGVDPDKAKQRGVMEAHRDKMRQPELRARLQAGLDPDVELIGREAKLFDRKDMNWLRLKDGSWAMSLGGEIGTLLLIGADTDWTAFLQPKGKPPTVLGEHLDLALAMGVAEEKVIRKNPKASALIDKSAPWRKTPASPGQLRALANWKIIAPAGITKGEAGDLLSAAVASKEARAFRRAQLARAKQSEVVTLL